MRLCVRTILAAAMWGFGGWAQAANHDSQAGHVAERACWVADFREMALTTHAVQQREALAVQWLKDHAASCTEEQLLMISRNRPAWMGNADTARVAAQIDREFEKRYVMSQRNMGDLFDSEPPRESTTEVIGTPAAPAPVVSDAPAGTVPAAVVIQPTINNEN